MLIQLLKKYKLTVNRLFLIDGIGALVSAFFLGIVLPSMHQYIGLPINDLYILSSIPVVFALYSLGTYFLKSKQARFLLGLIGTMNLLYSIFSAIIIFQHIDTLLTLGWVYFIAEFGIVLFISLLEFTAVKMIK